MSISHRTAGQVDEASAATAKQHSALFQALIMEPFYPVHAKAQRRVPDPEGVDLDTPINPVALQRIMDTETVSNVGLSTINFGVPVQIAAPDSSNPAFPQQKPMDPFRRSTDDGDDDAGTGHDRRRRGEGHSQRGQGLLRAGTYHDLPHA